MTIKSGALVVNVRNYGATGRGLDDTAALVAAVRHINSLGNQPVILYFPRGNYGIDPRYGMEEHYGLVLTASNVEIRGDDQAVIELVKHSQRYSDIYHVAPQTTFYWNYFEIHGSNVNVHDLTFDSNRMTTTGSYTDGLGKFWATALDINGTPDQMQNGNIVSHNRFWDIGGWSVNSSYQNNITITGNYATNSEGMGCGGQVYGCTITNNISENALDAHFFSNGSTAAGTQSQYAVISGNTAIGNSNGSGIDVTASWDTVVENNTISGNANWCILVGKSWGPYTEKGPFLPSQRVTLRGNTCAQNGWYQGWPMNAEIFVGEQYKGGDAGDYKPGDIVSDVLIENNTVSSQNSEGRGVAIGYGAARVTIDGNQLDGCGNGKEIACEYPKKPVIRVQEVGTDSLTVKDNIQNSQFAKTYIYLGNVGPYTISGNEMQVHQ